MDEAKNEYKINFGPYEVELKSSQVYFRKSGSLMKAIPVKSTFGLYDLKKMVQKIAASVNMTNKLPKDILKAGKDNDRDLLKGDLDEDYVNKSARKKSKQENKMTKSEKSFRSLIREIATPMLEAQINHDAGEEVTSTGFGFDEEKLKEGGFDPFVVIDPRGNAMSKGAKMQVDKYVRNKKGFFAVPVGKEKEARKLVSTLSGNKLDDAMFNLRFEGKVNEALSSSDIQTATKAIKAYVKKYKKDADGEVKDVAKEIGGILRWNDSKIKDLTSYLYKINKGSSQIIFGEGKTNTIESFIKEFDSSNLEESSAEYAKTLKKLAADKQLKNITSKDKETLLKIVRLVKTANESVEGLNELNRGELKLLQLALKGAKQARIGSSAEKGYIKSLANSWRINRDQKDYKDWKADDFEEDAKNWLADKR